MLLSSGTNREVFILDDRDQICIYIIYISLSKIDDPRWISISMMNLSIMDVARKCKSPPIRSSDVSFTSHSAHTDDRVSGGNKYSACTTPEYYFPFRRPESCSVRFTSGGALADNAHTCACHQGASWQVDAMYIAVPHNAMVVDVCFCFALMDTTSQRGCFGIYCIL